MVKNHTLQSMEEWIRQMTCAMDACLRAFQPENQKPRMELWKASNELIDALQHEELTK